MKNLPLDPLLQADSSFVTDLQLCQIRLSHNAAFPWIILIPQREKVIEIIDLIYADQHLLIDEISKSSQVMQHLFKADKLNIGALGNIVPQLHIHIIGRYKSDPAWPGPVWNSGVSKLYSPATLNANVAKIRKAFS